jgi:murein DD-endopeptidase MepM/ murein hydrolase activator NlpD
MNAGNNFQDVLMKHLTDYHPVVSCNRSTDKVERLDLSSSNKKFSADIYNDYDRFNAFIDNERKEACAKFLIGGYGEEREMYKRSTLFLDLDEPRSLHLGIDVWGEESTPVFTPLDGNIHSFKYNDNYGDYGATIIIHHQLDAFEFYLLYGHLALEDIKNIREGQFLAAGSLFAHFGRPLENGNWPPHLHFQLIFDMGDYKGDYPGVCKISEAKHYLHNSPDPTLLLNVSNLGY